MVLASLLTLGPAACGLPDKQIGDGSEDELGADSEAGDSGEDSGGDSDGGSETAASGDTDDPDPNPSPPDQDQDDIADAVDLCQLTPDAGDQVDDDKDGVGNACDVCRRPAHEYNLESAAVDDPRLWVRNNPRQADADHDGIGDVCDNCVVAANCGDFGPDDPHGVGVPTEWDNPATCQIDADLDMVGDACVGQTFSAHAAGPVSFAGDDDFDQDGLSNLVDLCPRQPVAAQPVACDDDGDCLAAACTIAEGEVQGWCNHPDHDQDGVGDVCDTCASVANPLQATDAGMQIDDQDGDFVGSLCESNAACDSLANPRPYAFMAVAVAGQCCTTSYPGDGEYVPDGQGGWTCVGLCDPNGFPIKAQCTDPAAEGDAPDGSKCRILPAAVAATPGVLELPPGCQQALDDAGLCAPQGADDPDCPPELANRRLTLADVDDPDQLWRMMCLLPQWDRDFDGLGDACDACPTTFDPFGDCS